MVNNNDFIKAVFGEHWQKAHVTSFTYDPDLIPSGQHLKAWFGGYYSRFNPEEISNQYFTISTFSADEKGTARRRKALFERTHCIVLDDVKEKLLFEEAQKLPAPSWVLETSKGSEQWGYILNEPCADRHKVENLLDGLVANGLAPDGKDPGMKGVTRYVRLPDGYNTKAKRFINGQPFKCRMLSWQPFNTVTLEQLAEPFAVNLDAVRREARTDGAADLSDHPLLDLVDIIRIKEVRSAGRFDITCPWVEEHTKAEDSGTAIFTNADGTIGFKCHHGACQDKTGNHLLNLIEESYPSFRHLLSSYQTERILADVAQQPVAPPPPVATNTQPTASSSEAQLQIVDLLDVQPAKVTEENADQLTSAKVIKDHIFNNKLNYIHTLGKVVWWNGRVLVEAPEIHIKKHIANSLAGAVSASKVQGTYKLLIPELEPLEELDPPLAKVFFPDYVMDFKGNKYPHCKTNRNSRTLAVNPSNEPPAEWLKFLNSIFEPNDGRAELLQEIIGWCLTRDNLGLHKMPMLIGVSRAGKGVILNILKEMLNGGSVPFNFATDLTLDKPLSSFINANVAIDYDAGTPRPADRGLVEARLKSITANDPINIKLIYTQKPWTGELNCKLIIATNEMPSFFDNSGALHGRFLPLVFTKSFKEKPDLGLPARLSKELPAITNWAFKGLQRLAVNKCFTVPQSSTEKLETIREAGNPSISFLNEYLAQDVNGKIAAPDLYQAYTAHCGFNNMKPLSRIKLNNLVEQNFKVTVTRPQNIKTFNGVKPAKDNSPAEKQIAVNPPPPETPSFH